MDYPKKELVRGEDYYCEIFGLSTEDKPTTHMITGSLFVEQDTGLVSSWNAEVETWYPLCNLGGGS